MLQIPDETRARLRSERERQGDNRAKIIGLLKNATLRPTRQRMALAELLFAEEHRHVTVDDLHRQAIDAGVSLSLATVYNTLNQFAEAGLVRKVGVHGDRTYFDTDTGSHQHFYIEGEDRVIDIPPDSFRVGVLPDPPVGYAISSVDVVITLTPLATATRLCSGSEQSSPGCRSCGACKSLDGGCS
ncbi:transcriptional repressor [Agrobacterium sp. S2]|nr:transcriptional repressor [Agrobacterium sp. S2]